MEDYTLHLHEEKKDNTLMIYFGVILGYFAFHEIIGYFILSLVALGVSFFTGIDFSTVSEGSDLYNELTTQIISIGNFALSLSMAIPLFFIFKDKLRDMFQEFKGNFRHHIITIISMFIGMFMLNILVNIIVLQFTDEVAENQEAITSIIQSEYMIFMVIVAVIFAPFIEELVFRKALCDLVEAKTNQTIAIIASGILFGVIHTMNASNPFTFENAILTLPYIALGGFLAYSYYYSKKNIWVPISIHFIQNLLSVIIALSL